MANQYSITVSDQADWILKHLKDDLNLMPSRVISTMLEVLGGRALERMYEMNRVYNEFVESGESKVMEYHVKKVRSVLEQRQMVKDSVMEERA